MAIFENPNAPIQPCEGVYCWYAEKADRQIAIYVGQAGKVQGNCPLEVPFIVGPARCKQAAFHLIPGTSFGLWMLISL
jgi:hypothetical protein